jgi:Leucine-rich repeat (LRR) protein
LQNPWQGRALLCSLISVSFILLYFNLQAQYKSKASSIDLSNNKISNIGKNFPVSLTHIVKLNLSKNLLKSLPDNFGELINLKHLDLYNNKIQTLPLSFGNLKKLEWLDVKGELFLWMSLIIWDRFNHITVRPKI